MAIASDRLEIEDQQTAANQRRPGLPFTFSGRAGEFFGIWIVNLLLSVVTLGIYSAWAKVRTKRYFYGNTKLDGSSFDYLASPIQILKGRLIAFAVFAAYAICSAWAPTVAAAFAFVMLALTPWAVVRSRAFNAFYSSYRNVRFGFDGRIAEAAKIYVLFPILAIFTVGLLWPYVAYRMDSFLVDNSRYGKTRFIFEGWAGVYYKVYIAAFFLFVVALAFYFPAFINGVTSLGLEPEDVDFSIFLEFGFLNYAFIMSAVVLVFLSYAYLATRLQNYLISHTRVGAHELKLDLEISKVLWIRLSNLVVIALSLGLMIPWAKIRIARYQIERMSLIPHGSLEALVDKEQQAVKAYGGEMGEGMDLDLGLGV